MKEVRPAAVYFTEGSAAAKEILESAIANGDDIVGRHFMGAELSLPPASSMEFHDCIFDNCRFIENNADRLYFVDVRFNDCDLSNLNMNGTVFQRAAFYRCRATGMILSHALAHQVMMQDCICRYLNMSTGDWQNAVFERTDLTNAAIQDCRLRSAKFQSCILTSAEFCHTPLSGMDLTTDEIEGIAIAGNELKGAVVTAYQASELAKLLGIIIKQ